MVQALPHHKQLERPRVLELLTVAALVTLADLTIYRGHGYAGLAVLYALAPALLLAGSSTRRPSMGFWILSAMLLLLAGRLLWLGSPQAVVYGFVIVVALVVTLHGLPPTVWRVLTTGAGLVVAAANSLEPYARAAISLGPRRGSIFWPSVIAPLAAVAVFGAMFVLANPNLVTIVVDWANELALWFEDLLARFDDLVLEIAFCAAAAWIAVGLLRPYLESYLPAAHDAAPDPLAGTTALERTPYYRAARNTLVSLIALFGVYLVFEFTTLWFREFPPGFYYAGYAHQGATWLTVALATVTLVMSLLLRGAVLRDPRLPNLKKLAWLWAAENLVLVLAVYHRMYIYIDFNGMTRMRTIGLFGITTVVAGFAFVLWKIVHARGFGWLVQRQIGALALAIYLFAITPVDAIVYRYNVSHVLAGDLPPAVQISVHPIDSAGALQLAPLMQCADPIIRDGVRALLAQRAGELETRLQERGRQGWTAYQAADVQLWRQLSALASDWREFSDQKRRDKALDLFHRYVYQWY